MKSQFNPLILCIFPCIVTALLMAGCSNHLVYVQEATLGVNLALGTEGTETLSIGYDRNAYAIVPENENSKDAMALLSVNKTVIGGINDIQVSEFIAGGEPAKKLAKNPQAVAQFRKKIYEGDE